MIQLNLLARSELLFLDERYKFTNHPVYLLENLVSLRTSGLEQSIFIICSYEKSDRIQTIGRHEKVRHFTI